MSEYYIAVPPDSTGKKVRHDLQIEIDYTNKTGEFPVGEIVVFETSGMQGIILLDHVGLQHPENHLHIKLLHGSPEAITIGENMVVNGVTIAQATGASDTFYIPATIAVGGNNPTYAQHIDKVGASSVRFAEGSPTFDAFGRMQVSPTTTITEHTFNYDGRDEHFSDAIVGTASITHNLQIGGMVFTTDTGATDSAIRTADIYNKYIPGQSQLTEMTVASGDTGKTNVRRRWGYFDENDGVFFELDGTDLYVVLRSSVSGSVVDTRVIQSDWNVDRVNGVGGAFNISLANLNVSKDIIYWIDLQWLGAGKIRFGVNINGSRIVCHELNESNVNDNSYMRTGSLPVRVEQTNTASPASVSQMKFFCTTVKTEGDFAPRLSQFSYVPTGEGVVTNTLKPIFSIRPKLTHNTRTNRIMLMPAHMSVSSYDTANPTNAERLVIEVYKNASLTGSTWAISGGSHSGAELDITASALTGGDLIGAMIFDGTNSQSIEDFFDYMHENLVNKANGTQQHYTFAARTIRSAISADVMGSITWKEVSD